MEEYGACQLDVSGRKGVIVGEEEHRGTRRATQIVWEASTWYLLYEHDEVLSLLPLQIQHSHQTAAIRFAGDKCAHLMHSPIDVKSVGQPDILSQR